MKDDDCVDRIFERSGRIWRSWTLSANPQHPPGRSILANTQNRPNLSALLCPVHLSADRRPLGRVGADQFGLATDSRLLLAQTEGRSAHRPSVNIRSHGVRGNFPRLSPRPEDLARGCTLPVAPVSTSPATRAVCWKWPGAANGSL